MKKIFFGLISLILFSMVHAGETRVKSTIKSVSVYLQGAQINREASVQMPAGIHTYIFDKLPLALDETSIRLKTPKSVKVLSVNYKINTDNPIDNESQLEKINQEIKAGDFELKKLKQQLLTYQQEEDILLKNSNFSGSEAGVNLTELKQAADFFRSRLGEIAMKKLAIEKAQSELEATLNENRQQLNKLRNIKPDPTAEVVVRVQSKTAGKMTLTLSYFVHAAGWIPDYDIRVDDVSKPLNLSVKARVYQQTGEDWDQVKLVLSTDNPQKSSQQPQLSTWYLNYGQAYRPVKYSINGTETSVKGHISDAQSGEPIPFANIVLERGGQRIAGGSTDFDGNYSIDNLNPGNYKMKISFVGYNTNEINGVIVNPGRITFCDGYLEASSQQLEEVVVTSYSVPLIDKDNTISGGTFSTDEDRMVNHFAGKVGGVNVRGGRSNASTNYIPQQQVQTPTNIRYEVELPYSIPSDGEKYLVRIVDHSIPTDYEYYCAPKIDNEVYLLARLTQWSDLHLLSGEASIYFEGSYLGKTYLDVQNTEDTLNISVGRDNSIIVTRELNKDLKAQQTLGSNVKTFRAYTIAVRNNRNVAIKLTIEDQIPVSSLREISVEPIAYSNAGYDQDSGKLSWKMELESQENKEMGFSYSVKYPKGKVLYLD